MWRIHSYSPEIGFNAEFLIERISNFVYDSVDSSKKSSAIQTKIVLGSETNPLKNLGNYNTKQRGAQNFCLIRIFGLLFGDRIPSGNHHLFFYFF